MFDKKQIDAYSNIKAPHGLYEKILDAKPRKSKGYLIPLVSSLAACLVLIFGIAAFSSVSYSPEVSLNGSLLSADTIITGTADSDAAPANAMRTVSALDFSVELKLDRKTEISVSEGSLVLENGERTQNLTSKGDVVLLWELNPVGETTEYTMTLGSFGKTQRIILTMYSDGSYTAEIK